MKNSEKIYAFHFSSVAKLGTSLEKAFAYLDDPRKLSGHMGKSSWMMVGSKMEIKLDERQGKGIGAKITLTGQMMGIQLYVNEVVVESEAPRRKSWKTVGPQKLIVMDQYKMGFELSPQGQSVLLKVFIDYSIPSGGIGYILGRLFGKFYARWCTEQMIEDTATHFKNEEPSVEIFQNVVDQLAA